MRISRKIYWILLCILLTLPKIEAQNNSKPTDFGTTGETNTNPDDSAVPINKHIIMLFIIGICYGIKINVQKKRIE